MKTHESEPALDEGARMLHQVAAGDVDALESLYDRFAPLVLGVALRALRDRAIAEEATQEAFLSIWKHASRFDVRRGSARSWILAIAHNRAVDAVRRQRPHAGVSLDAYDGLPSLPDVVDVVHEVLGRLDAQRVRVALLALTDAQRRCLELAYFGGLTQQEIAASVGAPIGTIKSRVRTGLLRLREVLAQPERPNVVTGFAVAPALPILPIEWVAPPAAQCSVPRNARSRAYAVEHQIPAAG